MTIAKQEEYREKGVKYGQLILNAINWQLNKGVKVPTPTKNTSRSEKVRSQKSGVVRKKPS